MRALGYFAYDAASPESRDELAAAFERYCEEGSHIVHGLFAEEQGGHDQWDALVSHVHQTRVGYLIVVPSAAHLGASIEEQIERILDMDSRSCEITCDDEEMPDILQNAVRVAEGPPETAWRRQRIREGMRAKAAKGLGLGRPPYGYRVGPDGVLRPVQHEAEIVRTMFRLYRNGGGGVRAIAKAINDMGHRTRKSEPWSMVTVRDILRNTAYIGTYRRFGLRLPGTYEPIVDPAEFRAVQEQMGARSPVRRHAAPEPFMLAGLLYCGHCGQRMMGVTRRQTWRRKDGERARKEYRYYQCQTRINRGECDYRTIRAEDVEGAVLEQARALEPVADEPADAEWGDSDRARAEARLRSLQGRYLTLVQRAANGGLTLPQLRQGIRDLDAERAAARELLELADGSAERRRELVEAERENLLLLWDDLDAGERQQALRAVVARAVLTDGVVKVTGR